MDCSNNPECKGIEYWEGTGGICYDCIDPEINEAYTDKDNKASPSSVYKKGIELSNFMNRKKI